MTEDREGSKQASQPASWPAVDRLALWASYLMPSKTWVRRVGEGVGRHRHTPASLSLPFLFPLRSARSSTREGTRPPTPERGLPTPPPHPGHSRHLRPLSFRERLVHTHTHTHTRAHTCMHARSPAQWGLFANPTSPRRHQEAKGPEKRTAPHPCLLQCRRKTAHPSSTGAVFSQGRIALGDFF